MKTTELRLNNWIYYSKTTKFPMQVVSLGTDYVYLDFEGNEGDVFDTDLEDMAGIELTEEILKKCGFEKVGMAYKLNQFIINNWGDGRLWLGNIRFSVEILYLHQLQNIYFALTGKEMEVKL